MKIGNVFDPVGFNAYDVIPDAFNTLRPSPSLSDKKLKTTKLYCIEVNVVLGNFNIFDTVTSLNIPVLSPPK
jgi:hypothetical protein